LQVPFPPIDQILLGILDRGACIRKVQIPLGDSAPHIVLVAMEGSVGVVVTNNLTPRPIAQELELDREPGDGSSTCLDADPKSDGILVADGPDVIRLTHGTMVKERRASGQERRTPR